MITQHLGRYDNTSLNEKTLLIGYYKDVVEKVSPLTKNTLEDGFSQAREVPPKNLSDSINQNLDKKLFSLVKNQSNEKVKERQFIVTSTGIKRVEELMSKKNGE